MLTSDQFKQFWIWEHIDGGRPSRPDIWKGLFRHIYIENVHIYFYFLGNFPQLFLYKSTDSSSKAISCNFALHCIKWLNYIWCQWTFGMTAFCMKNSPKQIQAAQHPLFYRSVCILTKIGISTPLSTLESKKKNVYKAKNI